jgi:gluconolactonase
MASPYRQLGLDEVAVASGGFKGPEGVVVDREGNVYGGGDDGVIRRLSPDGALTEVADTGGRPAGMALDRHGSLFVCDVGVTAVLKVTPDGDVSLFADRVEDERLWVPNFPVFDADGNLYVSNSWDQKVIGENPRDGRWVGSLVRLRPDGSGDVVARNIYVANGLAIDPREEAVYVLGAGSNNCYRIARRPDGSHGPAEVFVDDFGTNPDGMAFDAAGHLIVTLPTAGRLVVVDPDGHVSTLLDDPEQTVLDHPTNCAFGGPAFDDLYIASIRADTMLRVHLGQTGHPLYDRRGSERVG